MARTTYQDFWMQCTLWSPYPQMGSENGTVHFMERNGIHIIDLNKTLTKLEEAAAAINKCKVVFPSTATAAPSSTR